MAVSMSCHEETEPTIVYQIGGRTVSLKKSTVDKYSEYICPVEEKFLTSMMHVFGKDCNDQIMSLKIELDMLKELEEYGLI